MRTPEKPVAASFYPRAWAVWAGCSLAVFAALETAALRDGHGSGNTLSAQLRRRRRTSAAAIGLLAGWLVWHVGWEDAR